MKHIVWGKMRESEWYPSFKWCNDKMLTREGVTSYRWGGGVWWGSTILVQGVKPVPTYSPVGCPGWQFQSKQEVEHFIEENLDPSVEMIEVEPTLPQGSFSVARVDCSVKEKRKVVKKEQVILTADRDLTDRCLLMISDTTPDDFYWMGFSLYNQCEVLKTAREANGKIRAAIVVLDPLEKSVLAFYEYMHSSIEGEIFKGCRAYFWDGRCIIESWTPADELEMLGRYLNRERGVID